MSEKTTSLEAKLAKYSAVAGALVAGTAVNAQIVHTDLNPDVTVSAGGNYNLDFNNDATPDIQFIHSTINTSYTFYGYSVIINGDIIGAGLPAGNGVQGSVTSTSTTSGTSTYTALSVLNAGDPIGPGNTFIQQSGSSGLSMAFAGSYSIVGLPYGGSFSQGDFINVTDKFMGVEFIAGGNTHYGWIRLDVAADATTLTIKEYAFQATPNTAINAGDVGSSNSIADIDLEDKVTIMNQFDQVMVNVTPDLIGGQIVINDMMGKQVSDMNINDVNTIVPFNGLSTGIYTVTAQFEDGQITQKIYVR